jgi:hypothetical protein
MDRASAAARGGGVSARQPRRPVTYADAIDALHRLHLVLVRISATPRLPQAVRTELRLEVSVLAALLNRDDGRR